MLSHYISLQYMNLTQLRQLLTKFLENTHCFIESSTSKLTSFRHSCSLFIKRATKPSSQITINHPAWFHHQTWIWPRLFPKNSILDNIDDSRVSTRSVTLQKTSVSTLTYVKDHRLRAVIQGSWQRVRVDSEQIMIMMYIINSDGALPLLPHILDDEERDKLRKR